MKKGFFSGSLLLDCDGLLGAGVDARHAHDAVVGPLRDGLVVYQVIHVHGADVDAYGVSITSVTYRDCRHSFHLSL